MLYNSKACSSKLISLVTANKLGNTIRPVIKLLNSLLYNLLRFLCNVIKSWIKVDYKYICYNNKNSTEQISHVTRIKYKQYSSFPICRRQYVCKHTPNRSVA